MNYKSIILGSLFLVSAFPAFSQASILPEWMCGSDYRKSFASVNEITSHCAASYTGGNVSLVGSVKERRIGSETIFEWRCKNQSFNQYCFAYKKVDGVCGKVTSVNANASQLCNAGVAKNIDYSFKGFSNLSWSCGGLHGGKDVNCFIGGVDQKPKCGLLAGKVVPHDFFKKMQEDKLGHYCQAGQSVVTSDDADLEMKGIAQWRCRGEASYKNLEVVCKADIEIVGKCNSDFNEDQKNVNNICNNGTPVYLFQVDGYHYWSCQGGLGSDICITTIQKSGKVDGLCGSSHGKSFTDLPLNSSVYYLCQAGEKSAVTETDKKWSWSCAGVNGGRTVSCSANKITSATRVDGKCGAAQGQSFVETPKTDLCLAGQPSIVSGSGSWIWACKGANGGFSVTCKANKSSNKVNGTCGKAHGSYVSVKPTTELCQSGTPTSVSRSGPWTWSCKGVNGGSSENCRAEKAVVPVNGQCGSINGHSVITKPTTELCQSGTPSTVSGSGPWVWRCVGSDGGYTPTCRAEKNMDPIDGRYGVSGKCGASNGGTFTAMPTTGLCEFGILTAVTGNGPWSWRCEGFNRGSSVECSANISAPSEVVSAPTSEVSCGSDNGKKLSSFPSSNVCVNGRLDGYGSYGSSGPWIWVCTDDKGKRVTCRSI
jgi:hypothetical protein